MPKKSIVADINMDMYLPLFPLKYLEVQGFWLNPRSATSFAPPMQRGRVEVQADKEPDRNLFIRSDQYSFSANPNRESQALAFKFGYTPGSPKERGCQGVVEVPLPCAFRRSQPASGQPAAG